MKDRPIDTSEPNGSMVMAQLIPSYDVVIDTAPLHTSFSIELLKAAWGTPLLEVFDLQGEGHLRFKAANGEVTYRIWRYRADVGILDGVRATHRQGDGLEVAAGGGQALKGISLAEAFG